MKERWVPSRGDRIDREMRAGESRRRRARAGRVRASTHVVTREHPASGDFCTASAHRGSSNTSASGTPPASAGASVATTRIVVMSPEDAARVIVADPALASASASSGGGASPLPGVFEDEKKPIARRAEDLERDAEWRGGPVTRILRQPERHRPLLALMMSRPQLEKSRATTDDEVAGGISFVRGAVRRKKGPP